MNHKVYKHRLIYILTMARTNLPCWECGKEKTGLYFRFYHADQDDLVCKDCRDILISKGRDKNDFIQEVEVAQ
jgi:hypothetical protein